MPFLKLLFFALVFFQSFGVFASSESESFEVKSEKNNIVVTNPQKVKAVQSKEGIVEEASFEILPEEGHNQLKFLPITLSAVQLSSLSSDGCIVLGKIQKEYNLGGKCDQKKILSYINELCEQSENWEGQETLSLDIWISVCARCFEFHKEGSYEDMDNMFIIGRSFGDPEYRKISTKLFEYNGESVSEKKMYAIGIYLQSMKDYKVFNNIRIEQISCLYRIPFSRLRKKEPEDHVLSWCFDNAWDDSVTQDKAEQYKPILFEGF